MKTKPALTIGKKILAVLFSTVAGAGCMLMFFNRAGLTDPLVLLVSMAGVAFVAGTLLGWMFGAEFYRSIGVAALAGALVLCTPVIVVTYGFALLGTPILMAYAGVAAIGAKYSGHLLRLMRR